MNNITNITKLPRMRTLDECVKELHEIDNNTAVSKYFIRQLAITGVIPTVMVGKKRLINLDGLIEYLNNPQPIEQPVTGGIRKIKY
jgi:excisionase family DNA binding protein